jgi:deazaflavin-dependent oxidoreductase (nitroreductase family)
MPGMADAVQQPTAFERLFNRLIGVLFRLGLAPGYSRLLEVRGRKSGKIYTAPVFVLEHAGKQVLVAPRGDTQWAKNAVASGRVTLRSRGRAVEYRTTLLPASERAPYLREYLSRHAGTVKRFFTVQPGAPLEAFAAVADQHPVFALEEV